MEFDGKLLAVIIWVKKYSLLFCYLSIICYNLNLILYLYIIKTDARKQRKNTKHYMTKY